MNRNQIESEYKIVDGIIRNPDKFEGEPVYAPYFYDLVMNGMSDESDDRDGDSVTDWFNLDDNDKALFPELAESYRVALWQDDSGFVHTEAI